MQEGNWAHLGQFEVLFFAGHDSHAKKTKAGKLPPHFRSVVGGNAPTHTGRVQIWCPVRPVPAWAYGYVEPSWCGTRSVSIADANWQKERWGADVVSAVSSVLGGGGELRPDEADRMARDISFACLDVRRNGPREITWEFPRHWGKMLYTAHVYAQGAK